MCGIAGYLGSSGAMAREALLHRMTGAIPHRGPDADGHWLDDTCGVALGHRRLSIVDLSEAGSQPMASPSGRYVIVFNGEVYNHAELRAQLDAPQGGWRGHSDTETLLAAFERWGFEPTLARAIGMFALALWDRMEGSLVLARDRFGEKPLYWGVHGDSFLFASELKALKCHPEFDARLDRGSLALFFRHNYIPAPFSIYTAVRKLEAGCWMKVTHAGRRDFRVETHRYWSLRDAAVRGQDSPFRGTPEDAVEQLDARLREAVRLQMVADVPLGAFLSGGIDSSTVVGVMQALAQRPVRTFSIGFHETTYNEAQHAAEVARHLGTDHTELYVDAKACLDAVPLMPRVYDEPFADSSQIPTYLLSRLTREHVTVSLSGDAGDELFGGYSRYILSRNLWRIARHVPRPLRRAFASGLRGNAPAHIELGYRTLAHWLPGRARLTHVGDKVGKLAEVLDCDSPQALYRGLVSHWKSPASLVLGSTEHPTWVAAPATWPKFAYEHQMMLLDAATYLPDDILVKVDRAAMAASLETRVPFLDHRLAEFAWTLPLDLKIRDGQGKWVLRRVLDKYVPRELVERPKMGFGVPIAQWLRGPLKDWAHDLLAPARLKADGYLDQPLVTQKWEQHQRGDRNWQYHLWCVLMFQAWLRQEAAG